MSSDSDDINGQKKQKKTHRLLSGLKDAFKSGNSTPVEEHVMSVRVTVTTEHQIPDSEDEDEPAKYDHDTVEISSVPSRKGPPV